MPDRYHIRTEATPARFHRVGKFGGIDWREDCSRCSNCVKLRCCFDVYSHESAHNRDPLAAIRTLYECKACFSCVQGCTKGLLSLSVNPEFLEMGDEYWTPDTIASTWNQSDSGKIPVSGAGYRGPFHGPGFDSIWTDMSEIVRPTRDGIHGREYISTSVDIGPKPMRLRFAPEGEMLTPPLHLLELQLPAVLDLPPWLIPQRNLAQARAKAAKELRTLAVMFASEAARLQPDLISSVVPVFGREDIWNYRELLCLTSPMAQLQDCREILKLADQIREIRPEIILSVRLPLTPSSADRILALSRSGLKVFHLCADLHGRERMANKLPGRHIKDVLREIHTRLVQEGLRDEITLIISGGIALAEHMGKAIICGADLVAADTALLVSIGCRVCRNAHPMLMDSTVKNQGNPEPLDCPAKIGAVDSDYAARRMINLMGAWHSQLVEVLGAMGIREIRRLRGETGRAIFREEIEKEAFGDLIRVPQKQVCA
jgi:hypothetical protein